MEVDLELREMIKKGGFKSQKAFSLWAEVSESYITKWKKQGYIPDEIKSKFDSEFGKLIDQDIKSDTPSSNNLVTINLYEDIYASAGYGTNNGDVVPTKVQFDKNFLTQFFNIRRYDNLDIIRVIGDSMEPLIKDGEYIIVERAIEAKNGDTVIANINGELYVKRFHAHPLRKWIKLISENDMYGVIELDEPSDIAKLSIVGIVKSKIKLF